MSHPYGREETPLSDGNQAPGPFLHIACFACALQCADHEDAFHDSREFRFRAPTVGGLG